MFLCIGGGALREPGERTEGGQEEQKRGVGGGGPEGRPREVEGPRGEDGQLVSKCRGNPVTLSHQP